MIEGESKFISEKEKEEKVPKYVRGKLIDQSNFKPDYVKKPYDEKEKIYAFGKEYITKYGKQREDFFYAIEEGGKYYEVLIPVNDLEIVTPEIREDEWAPPQRAVRSFLRNKEGEDVGSLSSPRQYGDLEGWKIYGVGKPTSWEIIESPDGKLFRKLRPFKY